MTKRAWFFLLFASMILAFLPVFVTGQEAAPAADSAENSAANSAAVEIGSRLELFVDPFLIGSFQNTALKLHEPRDEGPVLYRTCR